MRSQRLRLQLPTPPMLGVPRSHQLTWQVSILRVHRISGLHSGCDGHAGEAIDVSRLRMSLCQLGKGLHIGSDGLAGEGYGASMLRIGLSLCQLVIKALDFSAGLLTGLGRGLRIMCDDLAGEGHGVSRLSISLSLCELAHGALDFSAGMFTILGKCLNIRCDGLAGEGLQSCVPISLPT